jgi:hypothetical protein
MARPIPLSPSGARHYPPDQLVAVLVARLAWPDWFIAVLRLG